MDLKRLGVFGGAPPGKDGSMSRTISWKNLSSRLLGKWTRRPSGVPTRPALARMERLDDRVLLSAAPSSSVTPPPAGDSGPAVDAFLKIEGDFIKYSESFLKIEGDVIEYKFAAAIKWNAVDYFLKIDADLLKVDSALIGLLTPAGAEGGTPGLDQVLLQKIDLSPDQTDLLTNVLVPAVQKIQSETLADQAALDQGVSSAAKDGWPGPILKRGLVDSLLLDYKFQQIEYKLVSLDPTDLTAPAEQVLQGLDSLVVDSLPFIDGDPDRPIITGQ